MIEKLEVSFKNSLLYEQSLTNHLSSSPTRPLLPYLAASFPDCLNPLPHTINPSLWPHCCICGVFSGGKHLVTGCLIADKYILTCSEPIKNLQSQLLVRFANGKEYGVKMVKPFEELAIIEVKCEGDVLVERGWMGCVFTEYVSKDPSIVYGMRQKEGEDQLYLDHFDVASEILYKDQIGSPLISIEKGVPYVTGVCISADRNAKYLNWAIQQRVQTIIPKQLKLEIRSQLTGMSPQPQNKQIVQPFTKSKYFLSGLNNEQFEQLSSISIGNCHENFMVIVQIPTKFERLYRLALPNNSIADQGVQFLLKKRLQYLEILDLSKNNLTVKGARIISQCIIPNLVELQLSDNKLMDEGVRFLMRKQYPFLQTLSLKNVQTSCIGAAYIGKTDIPKLQTLLLSQNVIGDEGFQALSKGHWIYLRILWLNNHKCPLTFEKIADGLLFNSWKSIKQIWIQKSMLSNKSKRYTYLKKIIR